VPVNVAKSFLAEAGVPLNVQSEFTKRYRAALDAAGGGNWTQAGKELPRAGTLFPNSPDGIRVSHDIDRAATDMPLWRQEPGAVERGFGSGGSRRFVRSYWRIRRCPGFMPRSSRLMARFC